MSIDFHVPGIPQPKGSTRAFRRPRSSRLIVTSANPKLKGWERDVYYAALAVRPPTRLMGAVGVSLVFTLPAPKQGRVLPSVRPDLDKLIRGCLDPLSGLIYNDDRQIVDVTAVKRYGPEPGASIRVESLA